MEFYERVSGARMHAHAFVRGEFQDLPAGLLTFQLYQTLARELTD